MKPLFLADRCSVHSQESQGFAADIFAFGLLYLYMLTAMCGGSITRLMSQKELPADTSRPNSKREKNPDQNFSNPDNLRWVIKDHLPSLQYKKIEKLCSAEEFEAIQDLIKSMISWDHLARPTASDIRLPPSFESSCCSTSDGKSHQQPPRHNFATPQSWSRVLRKSGLGTQIPELTVETVSETEWQLPQPALISTYSNRSFPFSRESTDVAVSPGLLAQKEEELQLPARPDGTTLLSQDVLTGLTLGHMESSIILDASIAPPWTTESRSRDVDWATKLAFFEELIQPEPSLEGDSPTALETFRTFVDRPRRRVSEESKRMSIPTFAADLQLQIPELHRRPSRHPTWPPEQPVMQEIVF